MIQKNEDSVASQARQIYQNELKDSLEPAHHDEFAAIEPISREYFLGKTLSEAIGASRARYPDRLAHALRVGHSATVHLGFRIQ